MTIRVYNDFPAKFLQLAQQSIAGVRCGAVAPGHGPGVDLKGHTLFDQVLHRFQCPAQIPGTVLIDGMGLFIELGNQVKVADPLTPRLSGQLGHQVVVGIRIAVPVAAEVLVHRPLAGLGALVHIAGRIPLLHTVDRTNHIVQSTGIFPKVVQLHAHKDFHPAPVCLLEFSGSLQVDGHILFGQAEVLAVLLKAMAGKAEVGHPQIIGRRRHLLQGALSVIQSGVGVKIAKQHGEFSFRGTFSNHAGS